MPKPALANIIIGGSILSLGIITLFSTIFRVDLNIGFWWPMFILIPGIGFGLTYIFSRTVDRRMVMPFVVLTLFGLTFLINNIASVYFGGAVLWATTSFMYPLAFALGFWLLWRVHGRELGNLAAAIGFSIITVLVFCFSIFTTFVADFLTGNGAASLIAPLLLVCVGLFVLILPFGAKLEVKRVKESLDARKNAQSKSNNGNVANDSAVIEAEIVQDAK